ncbi:MAG: hypothetical protein ACREV9_10590 [Burkholderiales bacterium]
MTKQIIAALALAFGTTAAFAADQPAKDADKKQPATEAMDKKAGAGGQDVVDQGKTPVPTAAKETGAEKDKGQTAGREADAGAAGKPAAAGQGRNWDAIDKDNNNLVSAEEMESWLKANPGPSAGSAGKEGKDAGKEPAAKEPAADKEKKQ